MEPRPSDEQDFWIPGVQNEESFGEGVGGYVYVGD